MDIKKYFNRIRSIIKTSRLESTLEANDYWALLFIGCISLFEHKLLILALLYIGLKTHRRSVTAVPVKTAPELGKIILFIHSNHLQSLTEAIESNPEILYCEYRKKSLLSWCKFYNNTRAVSIVMQLSQKYPKFVKEKQMAA